MRSFIDAKVRDRLFKDVMHKQRMKQENKPMNFWGCIFHAEKDACAKALRKLLA